MSRLIEVFLLATALPAELAARMKLIPGACSFRDAKVQRLENLASDTAAGLAVLAAAKSELGGKRNNEGVKKSGDCAK